MNGGAFVRNEQRGNPMTVRSAMPSLEALTKLAADLNLKVLGPRELGSTRDLDEFYIAALHRD